jgi:hypothetical protein
MASLLTTLVGYLVLSVVGTARTHTLLTQTDTLWL